ncbi:MAG: aminopeptidase [Bacteroidales bacterium]|nr:aminopeptidase [Bacteroidales bacterium]
MRKITSIILLVLLIPVVSAQKIEKKNFDFKEVKTLETISVKSQDRTGTCWCFGTTSFLETELIRMGKGEFDLSEMFFIRNAYKTKAMNYVRFHGKTNFTKGGQAHDVLNEIAEHGIVPESVYSGKVYGQEIHNHSELRTVIKGMLDGVIKSRKPTPVWSDAYCSVLDVYLGETPASFTYEGKTYTPGSFAEALGINPDDYIELTSYSHHPYYESFVLEIPDNWSYDGYYNLPVDDLIEVMKKAIKAGYSIAWDGDMSDKGFSYKNGVAIVPETDWDDMSDEVKDSVFVKPGKEKQITQEMRQEAFGNYTVTDDHLMHLTGMAKDKNGTYYFLTKNSWGPDSNDFGGYLYMSESFVRLHTIAFMVHKDAVPKDIKEKLGL